jgi:L-alanine-DL-glutamate epimerase-like enolase superfamily enzyme
MFKIKIGREPAYDVQRVRDARDAIGSQADIFVDANGAYTCKQALDLSERFAKYNVSWHEEPLRSDDLEGLRLLRDRGPAGMAITAGEYGYTLPYFQQMLQAGAVDILQADASRCGGITGFLAVARLAEAFQIPLSSHCCTCTPPVR